jgi:hypothetical protein
VEKLVSPTIESVEEKLAKERGEAREELKNADMGAFDRAIDALLRTGEKTPKPRQSKQPQ